jgi:hypothetical protein
MRCNFMYILDVFVDVYVTLFMYALSDQTHIQKPVREMCVLHGVIW